MRLSELKTGEKGVIVKVLGHGGFRKRIVEMGFIKGKTHRMQQIWKPERSFYARNGGGL